MAECIKNLEGNLNYHFSEVLNKPLVKPYWIYISLSHKCNFNCRMCGVKNVLQEEDGLSFELIKKILDEIASWGSDCVIMLTGGEPFLRKDIFQIIEYSVSLGLKTELVNNGSQIDNSEIAKRIIKSGIQNIAVSLDGVNPQTHDYIRGTEGAYKKTLSAIRYLSREKKLNNYGPQISVWSTIMKENIEELYGLISLTKDLGVECLVFHPVIVAQDDMQNTIKGGQLWITRDLIGLLKEQIDQIIVYQKENGLVAFLHDPYLWLNYFQGTLTKKDWKCNPFVFLNIGPDGFVRSCGLPFGNIKDLSLTECLNTKQADNARGKMQRCLKPCLQTCWAKPEADYLEKIVNNFLSEVDSPKIEYKERKEIIEKGIKLLSGYEALSLENLKNGK